ncbi:MAG: GNAT family N-acetyltransferase [Pseudonocardiaceae bacterium]
MTEIRNAHPGDAYAIAAVHVESWQATYHGLLPEGLLAGLSIPDREEIWSKILVDPPPRTAVLLATSQAAILGFVAIGPNQDNTAAPEIGQIYAIYRRPHQRGRGIGTQLHDAALDRLSTLGFTQGTLWVLESNEPASRFYHRHGWTADGMRRIEQGPGGIDLSELHLHRTLPAL